MARQPWRTRGSGRRRSRTPMVSRMGGRGGLVWAMTMTRYQLRRKGRGWEGLGGSLRRSSRWGSRRSRSGAKGRTRETGGVWALWKLLRVISRAWRSWVDSSGVSSSHLKQPSMSSEAWKAWMVVRIASARGRRKEKTYPFHSFRSSGSLRTEGDSFGRIEAFAVRNHPLQWSIRARAFS